MLRFSSLSDIEGRYLLIDPAREVTDLLGHRPPGRWIGAGSAHLGLNGPVDPADLAGVLRGQPPGATIQPHTQRRRSSHALTFAAPKPMSVLFASPDPSIATTVVKAHDQAVAVALAYVEARAAGVQRTSSRSGRIVLPVDGLIAATFTHGVSRSGDPHLHSHVLVANVARDVSGRFGSLDQRGFRAHLHAADALYRAELRASLVDQLGIRPAWGPKGTEIVAGIPFAEVVALSGRSADVRAGIVDRPPKVVASRAELVVQWERRRRDAPIIDEPPSRSGPIGYLDEHRFGAILSQLQPTGRAVVTAWCDAAVGGIRGDAVASVLRSIDGSLGFGVGETPLAPRDLTPSTLEHRVLGPRPTSLDQLERWRMAAASLSREGRVHANVIDRVPTMADRSRG